MLTKSGLQFVDQARLMTCNLNGLDNPPSIKPIFNDLQIGFYNPQLF